MKRKIVGRVWVVRTYWCVVAFDTLDSALNHCHGKYNTPQSVNGWDRHDFHNSFRYRVKDDVIEISWIAISKVEKEDSN